MTNNGDIGPYYGIWSLRELTANGEPTDCKCDNFFFKFQADIVVITETFDLNEYSYTYGTWQASDGKLFLNFNHHNAADPDGNTSTYAPPSELHIPAQAVTEMTIETITDKRLVMEYTSESGVVYHYSLQKLN